MPSADPPDRAAASATLSSPARQTAPTRSYHHGDLRRALVRAATEAIAETGPAALSLRELARRTGVSHAAAAHHFGDKTGLFTAVATEGFELLAASLTHAAEHTGSFLEMGVAYVRFALEHRAHFDVMFRPDLYHGDDAALQAASRRAAACLYSGVTDLPDARPGADPASTALAAWSLVHGFATLWLAGNLSEHTRGDASTADDVEATARAVARVLFEPGPPAGSGPDAPPSRPSDDRQTMA